MRPLSLRGPSRRPPDVPRRQRPGGEVVMRVDRLDRLIATNSPGTVEERDEYLALLGEEIQRQEDYCRTLRRRYQLALWWDPEDDTHRSERHPPGLDPRVDAEPGTIRDPVDDPRWPA